MRADDVWDVIIDFMQGRPEWVGTPTALYHDLTNYVESAGLADELCWGGGVNTFGRLLNEATPDLRDMRIVVSRGSIGRDRYRRQIIRLSWDDGYPAGDDGVDNLDALTEIEWFFT